MTLDPLLVLSIFVRFAFDFGPWQDQCNRLNSIGDQFVSYLRYVSPLSLVSFSDTTIVDSGVIFLSQLRKRNYQLDLTTDVVEWSRALDVRLSEWCCSVSMVWVQIPSREEQKFDSSKI